MYAIVLFTHIKNLIYLPTLLTHLLQNYIHLNPNSALVNKT